VALLAVAGGVFLLRKRWYSLERKIFPMGGRAANSRFYYVVRYIGTSVMFAVIGIICIVAALFGSNN